MQTSLSSISTAFTRRFLLASVLAAAPLATVRAQLGPLPRDPGFWSVEPATTWEEGLICGNGTIGANAFGRPLDETIVLTHERLFLPQGAPHEPPDEGHRLFEIRRLIDRGLYAQATQLAFDFSRQSSFMYPDPFVPAFDLRLAMEPRGEVAEYARAVDFSTGETTCRWSLETAGEAGPMVERRLFVSRADGVAVLELRGEEGARIGCRLELAPRTPDSKLDARTLERPRRVFEENVVDVEVAATAEGLTWRNRFAHAYPGSIHGVDGVLRVVAEEGSTRVEGSALVVEDARQVLVLVDVEVAWDSNAWPREAMVEHLAGLPDDYEALRDAHAKLHGELFGRMRLRLGEDVEWRGPVEDLLRAERGTGDYLALIEKEFDAGRYNIISCSGELPPTLQGVWGGTYSPGWASDFTHNGNVPSAIASMLPGNTPELSLAYTSYIESIVPWLEINADHMFGCRGIVLPSRSTTNGFNNALAPTFAGGFWVGGAPWAAHFFYDYWLRTGDREFLEHHALPFIEKAALFFEDYLYEGEDGKLVFSPTQSPENTPGNSISQGTFNATMDVAACRELLTHAILGSRELGVNAERIPVWQSLIDRLPDYVISEDGVLQEWCTPELADNLGHRHSSQLYPLFDGDSEGIREDPELAAAFRKIIEKKLDHHWKESSGFMSFGLVQLGLAAASLGEGELAYRCLEHLVERYWLNNLASMHNHKSLFNMDISGGMPAVIIQMLVQSRPGRIELLPALPKAWPSGRIEGVLCRGRVEVESLEWKRGWVRAVLRSAVEQEIDVYLPGAIESVGTPHPDQRPVALTMQYHENVLHGTFPAGDRICLEIPFAAE